MVQKIGRNSNTTDTATVSAGVTLNSTTSTKIADANSRRCLISITNGGSTNGVWLKLQPTSTDDDKKGIWLTPKTGSHLCWENPPDNIYTGEICAIADVDSPSVYVTEY